MRKLCLVLHKSSIVFALLFVGVFVTVSSALAAPKAKVTYLASEAVYINAGTKSGLTIGDTLVVTRKADTLAIVMVKSVSGSSAACVLLKTFGEIKVGDVLPLSAFKKTSNLEKSYSGRDVASGSEATKGTKLKSRRSRNAPNVVSGGVSIENLYRKDLTGSKLSSNQAGIRSRVIVKDINGSGIRFELRHRSRLYQRSRSVGANLETDEWSHQVYRLGITYGDSQSPVSWGFGRMLVPYVRGMGYVDGAFYLRRVSDKLSVGFAGGATPNAQTSGLQLERVKLGAFVRYEVGDAGVQRLSLTGSLTSETESFSVSRDFLYVQSRYTHGRWISLNQSFELEINRGWRRDVSGKSFEVSNYFGTVNLSVLSDANVYVTYDSRRNIRRFDNAETPDSLFDNSTHRGVRGGFRIRARKNLRFHGNLGLRLRGESIGNNTFASFGARLNRFPRRGHSLALNMSYVQTQFTTGYRPNVTYRFPIGRRTRVYLTGSLYTYKTGTTTVSNYYLDLGASRPLGKRYFFTGSYRQYFDSALQSGELYTEIGLRL